MTAEPVATWWRSHSVSEGRFDAWRISPAALLPGVGPLNLKQHSCPADQQGDTVIFVSPGDSAAVQMIAEAKQQGLRVLVEQVDALTGSSTSRAT